MTQTCLFSCVTMSFSSHTQSSSSLRQNQHQQRPNQQFSYPNYQNAPRNQMQMPHISNEFENPNPMNNIQQIFDIKDIPGNTPSVNNMSMSLS